MVMCVIWLCVLYGYVCLSVYLVCFSGATSTVYMCEQIGTNSLWAVKEISKKVKITPL